MSVRARSYPSRRRRAAAIHPIVQKNEDKELVPCGGHEIEFVDKVSEALVCHICTKPLRDPHLTKCCGNHVCESCLEQWSKKHKNQNCPICRTIGEDFQHFLDKKTKRAIDALRVHCTNKTKGCTWMGELGALKAHLDAGARDVCDYVYIHKCPNGCTAVPIMRKDLHPHLENECQLRPFHCKYCGLKDTYRAITGAGNLEQNFRSHYDVCCDFPICCPNVCGIGSISRKDANKHQKMCPLEKVGCPFGCESGKDLLRKDELEHLEKNIVSHQLLMYRSFVERDQVVKKAIAKNLDLLVATCSKEQQLPLQSIRSLIDPSFCLKTDDDSLQLSIPDISRYARGSEMWYSPPFYIGDIQSGMKVCLTARVMSTKSYVGYYGHSWTPGTSIDVNFEILESELQQSVENSCCTTLVVKVMHDESSEPKIMVCECQKPSSMSTLAPINIEIANNELNIEVHKSSSACMCVCHLDPLGPLL